MCLEGASVHKGERMCTCMRGRGVVQVPGVGWWQGMGSAEGASPGLLPLPQMHPMGLGKFCFSLSLFSISPDPPEALQISRTSLVLAALRLVKRRSILATASAVYAPGAEPPRTLQQHLSLCSFCPLCQGLPLGCAPAPHSLTQTCCQGHLCWEASPVLSLGRRL